MASMQGVIKRLISDKGFGFVQASDGNEYFFHQSAVVDGRFDEANDLFAKLVERLQRSNEVLQCRDTQSAHCVLVARVRN